MCSNASITEILEINDNNLVILGNEKENIKGIEYTVLRGKLSYRPACCPKCGIVNENYDITKNGSQTVKILFGVTSYLKMVNCYLFLLNLCLL
nr:transposase [uncultured Peptostreptococcus sp.]